MKKITTTAIVAVMLSTSAPAHANVFSSFGNWATRTFHTITGSKPTAYDRVYNSAYRDQRNETAKSQRATGRSSNSSGGCYSCNLRTNKDGTYR